MQAKVQAEALPEAQAEGLRLPTPENSTGCLGACLHPEHATSCSLPYRSESPYRHGHGKSRPYEHPYVAPYEARLFRDGKVVLHAHTGGGLVVPPTTVAHTAPRISAMLQSPPSRVNDEMQPTNWTETCAKLQGARKAAADKVDTAATKVVSTGANGLATHRLLVSYQEGAHMARGGLCCEAPVASQDCTRAALVLTPTLLLTLSEARA